MFTLSIDRNSQPSAACWLMSSCNCSLTSRAFCEEKIPCRMWPTKGTTLYGDFAGRPLDSRFADRCAGVRVAWSSIAVRENVDEVGGRSIAAGRGSGDSPARAYRQFQHATKSSSLSSPQCRQVHMRYPSIKRKAFSLPREAPELRRKLAKRFRPSLQSFRQLSQAFRPRRARADEPRMQCRVAQTGIAGELSL